MKKKIENIKIKTLASLITVFLVVISLMGCNENVIYDHNQFFEEKFWKRLDTLNFDFDIDYTQYSYNLYLKLRYTNQYPFYNLYIKKELYDSFNKLMADSLYEMILFDPKRGKPQGSGSTGVFDLVIPLYKNKKFKSIGKYRILMLQYMRVDTLKNINYVGLQVEKNE